MSVGSLIISCSPTLQTADGDQGIHRVCVWHGGGEGADHQLPREAQGGAQPDPWLQKGVSHDVCHNESDMR